MSRALGRKGVLLLRKRHKSSAISASIVMGDEICNARREGNDEEMGP